LIFKIFDSLTFGLVMHPVPLITTTAPLAASSANSYTSVKDQGAFEEDSLTVGKFLTGVEAIACCGCGATGALEIGDVS
jgi:hypothetical protein